MLIFLGILILGVVIFFVCTRKKEDATFATGKTYHEAAGDSTA
jgi:hypothetical protein